MRFMRDWKELFTIAIAGLFLGGCGADVTNPVSDDDAMRAKLISMGFPADRIVESGDVFIVDGDIVIAKSTLRNDRLAERPGAPIDPGKRPRNQWHSTATLSYATTHTIRVHVKSASSGWWDPIRNAMSEWNALTPGSTLNFVEDSITPEIRFFADNGLASNVCARAKFPSSGAAGDTIRINPAHDTLDAGDKKFLMAHELGHTIGFRHTNWAGNEDASPWGANQIPGTPSTDANSVMNGSTCGFDWAGFSYYDKLGGFNLYPPAGPTITPTYPSGIPTLSWNSNGNVSQYVVKYAEYGQDCTGDPEIPCTPYENFSTVGTTSGTSTTDVSRSYTGSSGCSSPNGSYRTASYFVYAEYPGGGVVGNSVAALSFVCPY